MLPYYIVVEEWNYPTESGRNILTDFTDEEGAFDLAKDIAEAETRNFFENTAEDPLPPAQYEPMNGDVGGYLITGKDDSDMFYCTRVFRVDPARF